MAQAPPSFPPQQLDSLVSRVALYPDPLLAQVLAAATFPGDIPDAARWADQHHYITGDALARDIEEDQLPWDPSVQALLPFPSVLGMMASDLNWTRDLGDAFLAQDADVMDAVQRMRREARDFGYLRSNGQIVVSGGPYIEIAPVNPAVLYVPYYDPLIVFARPRPGFVIKPEGLRSVSESRLGQRSGRGAGAAIASCGARTRCSSIMPSGIGTGSIGAHTSIRTRSGELDFHPA